MTSQPVVLNEIIFACRNELDFQISYLMDGESGVGHGYTSAGCSSSRTPLYSGIVTLLSTQDNVLSRGFGSWKNHPSSYSSPDDEDCEDYFQPSVIRNESGSYTVRLPVKKSHPPLGNSYNSGKRSLFSLERQF